VSEPLQRTVAQTRRWIVLLVTLAIVLGAVLWVYAPRPGGPGDAVPGRVHVPWLWQATVGQSPPGPAAVMFSTDRTIYFETTSVVVGRNGSYRLLPLPIGQQTGPLSPDGRYAVVDSPARLVDLSTGDRRELPADRVLAWSRDGRQVLAARYRDDAVIEYGPDGRQLNDPRRPDDLMVVEVATGAVRPLVSEHLDLAAPGAFAPDGRHVVVAVGDRRAPDTLKLLDAADGTERWSAPLGPHWSLAGPGAWSGDGRRVAVYAFIGCVELSCSEIDVEVRQWRIEFVDIDTGLVLPNAAIKLPGEPITMLGMRHGTDPVVVVREPLGGGEWRTRLVAVRPDGGVEVLLDPPSSVNAIDVPGGLVEAGRFGGRAERPNPFAARPGAVAVAALVPVLVLAIVMLRRWLRRRRT
jgi:hypothetical protein